MKGVAARKVRDVLRRQCGLRPLKRGKATGHEIWMDYRGRICHPMLRQKDVPYAALYSLGMELESQGIALRQVFLTMLKTAA